MRNASCLLLASLSLLVLSACGDGAGDGSGNGATGGTAREYTRAESEVTALPNGLGWTASRIVTLSNDDAGASRAAVRLRSVNGAVTSSAAAAGSYQIQITLQADAPTEAQAREALATLLVEHRDGTAPGALYLDTEVEFAPYSGNNANRLATITAALPGELDYDLYQSTANGGTTTSGLGGPEVQLFTANGDAAVSGTWDEAAANTANGAVSASGDIAALQASTDNGSVTTSLAGTRHTTAELDSDNGSIDAKVNRTLTSTFDLEGHTDVGTVSIVVAGTEPVGEPTTENAHYRSPEYAAGNPRVRIDARTSVGSVAIHE